MHPVLQRLIIELSDKGISPETTIKAAVEAWEDGVPLSQIPVVVRSQLGPKQKYPESSPVEQDRELARRQAAAEEARLKRAKENNEQKEWLTNPGYRRNADDTLRKLERAAAVGDPIAIVKLEHWQNKFTPRFYCFRQNNVQAIMLNDPAKGIGTLMVIESYDKDGAEERLFQLADFSPIDYCAVDLRLLWDGRNLRLILP